MTLKVLCTIGIQDAFTVLASTLEQYTGTAIDVSFGVAIMFKEKIKEGADFDVAILTRSIVEDLVASGDIVPSSVFDVARSGLGLAVRQNAPKPDIGTVDSLKRTLLEADSIASSGNGLAGFYFMDVLAELGIAERIRPKLKLDTSGGYAAQIAARGDAQLAVQLVSVSGILLWSQLSRRAACNAPFERPLAVLSHHVERTKQSKKQNYCQSPHIAI